MAFYKSRCELHQNVVGLKMSLLFCSLQKLFLVMT